MAKKMQNTTGNLRLRTSAWVVTSALLLAGLPLSANAAGLGKITVRSALGQPLRAEVEVFATREELAGLSAQLASLDAFKQSGIDYSPTLLGIRFTVDKRSNGQTFIKLQSDRPINDPFVDLLLEVNWPSGRVIREYTFLLDPIDFATRAPAAPSTTRPLVPPKVLADESATERPARREAAAKPSPSERVARSGETYEVRRGETLGKIASELRPEGVSLDQMLVGLLQANPDAFDAGNMNRLKAGKILVVPDAVALGAIPKAEARKLVVAQSSDWGGYRQKLAAGVGEAPASDEVPRQQASGRITTRVEEKAAPHTEARDQLRVSRTDVGGKPSAVAKRADEDLIAKEKALKEANERLVSLERSVAELQRLVELKSQTLAELEKQAAGKAPATEAARTGGADTPRAPAPAAKSDVSPPVVAAPPTPPTSETVVGKPGETPPVKPETPPPSVPEVKPEVAKVPAEVKPAEPPPPAPAPKPKVIAPPPPEPSFVEELLTSTPFLAGSGGLVALLAAYWLARRRNRNESDRTLEAATSPAAPRADSLLANSVFHNTGGQSVDTSHSMAQTDFSQAGPGSIDTDEVDPVAEADVYMAYGRDAQAEEILLEAKQKDPRRHAIHLKLLEIYLARKDSKPFDTLAAELFTVTGGVGADWEKAAAMGRQMDPQNPLYGASGPTMPPVRDSETTIIVRREPAIGVAGAPPAVDQTQPTVVIPRETAAKPVGPAAAVAAVAAAAAVETKAEAVPAAAAPQSFELAGLDFDLGMGDTAPATVDAGDDVQMDTMVSSPTRGEPLDFDLATSYDEMEMSASAALLDDEKPRTDIAPPEATMLIAPDSVPQGLEDFAGDFSFDLREEAPTEASAVTEVRAPTATDEVLDIGSTSVDALEFDVKLTESAVLGEALQRPSFDFSGISLDLTEGEEPTPAAAKKSASSFESEQEDTLVNPDFTISAVDGGDAGVDSVIRGDLDLSAEPEISSNEEVATKIDLAKAYHEMGDIEGARELLQEVLRDGDAKQREVASTILAQLRD